MKLTLLTALVPVLLAAAISYRATAVPAEPAFEEPSMGASLDAARAVPDAPRAVPYHEPSIGESRGYVIVAPQGKAVAGNDDFRKLGIKRGATIRELQKPVTR